MNDDERDGKERTLKVYVVLVLMFVSAGLESKFIFIRLPYSMFITEPKLLQNALNARFTLSLSHSFDLAFYGSYVFIIPRNERR